MEQLEIHEEVLEAPVPVSVLSYTFDVVFSDEVIPELLVSYQVYFDVTKSNFFSTVDGVITRLLALTTNITHKFIRFIGECLFCNIGWRDLDLKMLNFLLIVLLLQRILYSKISIDVQEIG